MEEGGTWGGRTSEAVITRAFQSTRGSIFIKSFGFASSSADSSSQSLGWRGKLADEDLQALTAQERKLSVRTFMMFRGR
jgi:hypothetical protein